MNERRRPDLGFGQELDGFDPADWAPPAQAKATPRPEPAAPKAAAIREMAEQAGFRSREPKAETETAVAKPVRRRRTGRSAQFNLKARPETIDAFTAVADAQGWSLAETFEYATALLEKTYGRK